MSRVLRAIVVLAPICAIACASATAARADSWKDKQGNCESTAFKRPETTNLDVIGKCVRLWQAYRDLSLTNDAERKRVAAAMMKLYVEGDEKDAHVAKVGLRTLKIRNLPEREGEDKPVAKRRDKKEPEAPKVANQRKKCSPPEPDKSDIKAAKKFFKKGFKAYKAEDYEGALAQYQKMMDVAPGWHKSIYNTAAMRAILRQEKEALDLLYCLRDLGTEDSIGSLRKSRQDADFFPIRDKSSEFKELTGYAKIKIGNGLGEQGEDNVDNLVGSLKKLGYEVSSVKETGKRYKHPWIWYKPHSKIPAFLFKKVMDHPATETRIIDWKDEEYDIIVAWGDDIKPDEDPPMRVPDPDDAEKSLTDIQRQENEIMREPDQYTRKVDNALDTPDRAEAKVERMGDKAEDIMNAPEKAADKVKEIGDKFKF